MAIMNGMTIPTLVAMLVLSLSGIFVCRLIVLHLMNRDGPLGKRLCSNSGKFDCDRVLGSDLGKITKAIHLVDTGLVYFIFQTLFLLFEAINGKTGEAIGIIIYPSLLAFVLSFVSLIYQGFIIKAWCRLCLIVIGILWLQAAALIVPFATQGAPGSAPQNHFLQSPFQTPSLPSLLTFAATLILAGAWLFIKKSILMANEVNTAEIKLLLFKKNANVFRALLRPQRTVNADLWEDDFVLGDKEAPTQLLLALNPYCPACGVEYEEVLELLRAFPGLLRVVIRFSVYPDKDEKGAGAVRHLLNEYASAPIELRSNILARWFIAPSMEHGGQTKTDVGPDCYALMKRHQQWCEEAKITHTPTLFINGYEFPKLFTIPDLILLVPKFSKRPLKTAMLK